MRRGCLQVRSDSNFDFTQGGILHELCVRMERTNLGVRLGTPDEAVTPPVNVIYMCMTSTPPEDGVFVDNDDGTYSIILPRLEGLDDAKLSNSLASGSPMIIQGAPYEWQTNVVLMGTHTLDVSAPRPSTQAQEDDWAWEQLSS